MTSPEKRRSPRIRHNSVVEIYDDRGNSIAGTGRLVDYSKVGACFSCQKIFTVNSQLRIRLRLLREGRLYIRGRILWVRKRTNTTLYGFVFDDVHEVA